MSHGKPYTVFKRKNSPFYYTQFKLPDGKWSVAKSTGETSKGRAERWAIDYLTTGQIVKKENVTFAEYSKDFYLWDNTWATDKRSCGLRISQHHCFQQNNLVNGKLIPHLGKMKLTDINRAVIKDYRIQLFKQGYAGNTINKILSALKLILDAAEEEGLIQYVPKFDRAANNPKKKGVLTVEEVKKLFSFDWMSDPAHCHPPREQFKGYAGNLLACSSGLRMGEIQALVLSDVHLREGYIHVRRSWDRKYGLNETTKNGMARNILIPAAVQGVLERLININPHPGNPESFVFFSDRKQNKPIEPDILTRSLYTAIRRIGISEEKRRERNLTFHSHRYFFNSLLINAKVPLQKIQLLTGHMTPEMTQHYYKPDDLHDVRQIQESIFNIQ